MKRIYLQYSEWFHFQRVFVSCEMNEISIGIQETRSALVTRRQYRISCLPITIIMVCIPETSNYSFCFRKWIIFASPRCKCQQNAQIESELIALKPDYLPFQLGKKGTEFEFHVMYLCFFIDNYLQWTNIKIESGRLIL